MKRAHMPSNCRRLWPFYGCFFSKQFLDMMIGYDVGRHRMKDNHIYDYETEI